LEGDPAATVPGLSKHRLEAIIDGIYVIAMTLAVLNIDITKLPSGTAASTLGPALIAIWPQVLHYTIAFLTLGAFWVGLHRQFYFIRTVDRRFIWYNLFHLLFISLIPFSSSLAGDFSGTSIAIQVFALNMFLIGTTMALGWRYASRDHRLIDPELPPSTVLYSYRRSLVIPVLSVLVMVVATVLPDFAMMTFLLIPLMHWSLTRLHRDGRIA
jgi:uncharacterized membrane protein